MEDGLTKTDAAPTVSGTGHTKKPRDWKAINAKRSSAVAGASVGVSRWRVEEHRRFQKTRFGDEFDDRIRDGELTLAQAQKIVRDRMLTQISAEDRDAMPIGCCVARHTEALSLYGQGSSGCGMSGGPSSRAGHGTHFQHYRGR
jgi:hypothetical protein